MNGKLFFCLDLSRWSFPKLNSEAVKTSPKFQLYNLKTDIGAVNIIA